jgi:glucose/arabinose dehydrogenase
MRRRDFLKLIPLSVSTKWLSGCSGVGELFNDSVEDEKFALTGFQVDTLVSGLDTPWEIAWGPDDMIWVTERGGTVRRVDPDSGLAASVENVGVTEIGESGLLGMAFHPDFDAQPFVYLAHSFRVGNDIRNRLVRMRFNGVSLEGAEVLLDNIPGDGIHNGSRLAIGRDRFLYMTTGDANLPHLSQDLDSVAGKVLRFTLDGQPAPGNPFGTTIYSYGHRNAQGLVFHPETDDLYLTEHGPADNDEVNRVEIGRNYGWPNVHGFCDNDVRLEEDFCNQNRVAEPVATWTPTVAPCGADFYNADLIPGWKGSFLFTTLRGESLIRLTLSTDGSRAVTEESLFEGEFGRLRDVMVGPHGQIYLATSNRDGRGTPAPDDDRILRVEPELVVVNSV